MSIYKKIPNWLTLINLLLGCVAIVYLFYDHVTIRAIAQGGYEEGGYFDGRAVSLAFRYGQMHIAALIVLFAVFFDFLDGFAARLFDATSEMGKQLDSLADLVTFGVAPGLMLYYLTATAFFGTSIAMEIGIWAFLPAFFYTLMAAWRLARFNTATPKPYFEGLPAPAAAIAVAALPLIAFRQERWLAEALQNPWVMYGIIAGLGWLMQSRLPLLSLKLGPAGGPVQHKAILGGGALVLAIVAYLFTGWIAGLLWVIILWYILLSLLLNLTRTS